MTERQYYIYFHKDRNGKIFYVGKGSGNRAWSTDRHPVWRKYVYEFLGGDYYVTIYKKGLTEDEAEELEWDLISKYGAQLVNWINPGRDFNYETIQRYHQRRNKNRAFVQETRQLEASDPKRAIERYRAALEEMRNYEAMKLENGLVAEIKQGPDWGDPQILDRLTLCLIRFGESDKAIEEADAYFAEFPSAKKLAIGKAIVKRIEKHRSQRQTSSSAARNR
jgi:hypothetical protein